MYKKDKEIINLLDDEKKPIPIKITFVEKKDDIYRSTLYSFDGPFQLLHVDMENLEFLGKSTADPKYCLLFVDLFTSKVYVYPMKSRKSVASKMDIFHREVEPKRKGQRTRLPTDQEFKQRKIYDLNKKRRGERWKSVCCRAKTKGTEKKEYLDLRP